MTDKETETNGLEQKIGASEIALEGQVEFGPEQRLAALNAEAESLDIENARLAADLLVRYVELLKASDPKSPFFREIIDAKRRIEELLRAAKVVEQKEVSLPEKTEWFDRRLLDEAEIPEGDRAAFVESFEKLPPSFKDRFAKRLSDVLREKNEVKRTTALRGATFEMSRIVTLADQGLEELDENLNEASVSVSYVGYEAHKNGPAIDFSLAPSKEVKDAGIQFDVPMLRNGKPYVYETKSYPRMQFGSSNLPQSRNQLLKYQAAIEQGLIDGATVEVKGRIERSFLDWAAGEKVDDPGHVPDVEIIYNIELPSGKEYRVVLKRTRKDNGLQFQNEDAYDARDLQIIRGVQLALEDKSITPIITEVNIDPEQASEELRPCLEDPMTIGTLSLFAEYEALRRTTIHEALGKKVEAVKINRDNKKSATSEYANLEFVEHLIEEYQDFLAQNPEVAKTKSSYVISPERIPEAVARTMAAIERIASSERTRQSSVDEAALAQKRQEMGYRGRVEGVSLDIDHIMMDVIYAMNKEGADMGSVERAVGSQNVDLFIVKDSERNTSLRYKSQPELMQALTLPENQALRVAYDGLSRGSKDILNKAFKEAEFVRSYDWPERFTTVENIPTILEGQDRRYMELQFIDPLDDKVTRQANTNQNEIEKTQYNLLRENVQRARDHIQGTKRETQNKKSIGKIEVVIKKLEVERDAAIAQINQEAKQTASQLSQETASLKKLRTEKLKSGASIEEVAVVDLQIEEISQKRMGLFEPVKAISVRYQQLIQDQYVQLTEVYKQIIPESEWRRFARRVTKTIDQNIVKFIYVVTPDENVVVQEEIIRGDVSGRAAHSELAQGRNVYGAGEVAFTKIDDKWVLTEINNGSGHYRPDASSTLHYVRSLVGAKGVNIDKALLVDSILRGLPLRDASAF